MYNNEIKFNGISLTEIIAEYWKTVEGGEPEWDIQNNRNTKIFDLVVNIRDLVERNEEIIKELIPTYGLDEKEYNATIQNALKSDSARSVTKKMRQIVNKLKSKSQKKCEIPFYQQLYNEITESGWPIGYQDLTVGVPEIDKLPAMICVSAGMTPFVDHIRYRYADNTQDRCILQVCVCGHSSLGKSAFIRAVEPLKDILRERQKEGEKALAKWKKLSKKKREETEKPECVMQLGFSNVTDASIRELVFNAKQRTTFFTTNEVSSISLDSIQTILQRGWAGEEIDSYRSTAEGITGRERAFLSCLVEGTEPDVYHFLFGGKRSENGVGDRFIPCIMEKRPDLGIPWYADKDEKNIENIQEAVRLLEEPIEGELNTRELMYHIQDWVMDKVNMSEKITDEVERDAVLKIKNRSARNGFRAAIPFYILSGRNIELTVKFMIMVAEYCFQMRYRMWNTWNRNAPRTESPVETFIAETKKICPMDDILRQLPEFFDYKLLISIYPGSKQCAYKQRSRWETQGKITPVLAPGQARAKQYHNNLYERK